MTLLDRAGSVVARPWATLAPGRAAVREAVAWAARRPRDRSLARALAESGAAAPLDRALLEHHLAVEVETEYGASARELSAWWGQEEGSSGRDLLVLGGYGRLADALARGLDVRLGRPVTRVVRGRTAIELRDGAGAVEQVDRAVVTVPLGVLRGEAVRFAPQLPVTHRTAIAALGMGLLDKLWLRFDEPFWTGRALVWSRMAPAGTPWIEWYDLLPLTGQPVLMSLVGGDTARAWATRSDDEVLAAALESLGVFLAAGSI
jgi:monoamine oxidase